MIANNIKYIHRIGEYAVVGLRSGESFLLNSVQLELVMNALEYDNRDNVISNFLKTINVLTEERVKVKELIENYFNKLETMGIFVSNQIENNEKQSISITGYEGKYYPYRIALELTNACIAYCSHCFKKANDGIIRYLEYSDILKLNSDLCEQFQIVHLTGGEPLLHPEFERIMHLFKNKEIELNTNGILIKNYPIDIFKGVKALSIGIYGLSDREYLENTGIHDGFTALCESCRLLKEADIKFSISLVINQHNVKELNSYVATAYSLGANEFIPGLANKIGRLEYPNEKNCHWILSQGEKKYAYRTLRELGKKFYGKIMIDDWGRDGYRTKDIVRETEKVYKNRCFQCGAGTMKWTITENFMFKPCTMFLDCPQLYLSYREWLQYIQGEKEIIWSEYMDSFIENCNLRGTIPSEYCDFIPESR